MGLASGYGLDLPVGVFRYGAAWGTGFLSKMLAPLIGVLMKRTHSGQLIALREMIEGDDDGR